MASLASSEPLQEVNNDEATMAQVEQIQKEVAESNPLVGEREDLFSLEKEYAKDDTIYQAKVEDLLSRYSQLRRTRGDGNCFFRAFAFGYLESVLRDKSDLPRFRDAVGRQRAALLAMEYPAFTLEDFHDNFMDVLDRIAKPGTSVDMLKKTFQDPATSEYIVCYLRILTSGYIQAHEDFYQSFIEGGRTVKEYCSQEVEPMYHESDHMHITALTAALGVAVRVEYMDRGDGGRVNHHDFPEHSDPSIYLLYRPGHYDLLYAYIGNNY